MNCFLNYIMIVTITFLCAASLYLRVNRKYAFVYISISLLHAQHLLSSLYCIFLVLHDTLNLYLKASKYLLDKSPRNFERIQSHGTIK